jgi:hypothetical protein
MAYPREFPKQFVEYVKHLTALSTGSILILTAFLEKVFVQRKWKAFVLFSLLGFGTSVIAAVITYTQLLDLFSVVDEATKEKRLDSTLFFVSVLLIWIGFLVGIVALLVFCIRNLF